MNSVVLGGEPNFLPWLPLIAVGVLTVPLWFFLGMREVVREAPMERSNRVAQLYGYTVCLIAVVTFLLSSASLVRALFDLSHPLQSQAGNFQPALTSFEAYKATQDRAPFGRASFDMSRPPEPDSVLRTRWEALRADRTAEVAFGARRTLATDVLLILIATVLFGLHWRWLRRAPEAAA